MCGRTVSIKCWVCWVALACSAVGIVVTGAEVERSASVSPVPEDVQVQKLAGVSLGTLSLFSQTIIGTMP